MKVANKVFIEIFIESNKYCFQKCLEKVKELKFKLLTPDQEKDFDQKLLTLYSRFNKRWKSSKRYEKQFNRQNAAWIESEFNFEFYKATKVNPKDLKPLGRPSKPFSESSANTKRVKAD